MGSQVALVARLRWQIFRNSLRNQNAVVDLIGTAAVLLLLITMTVGGAVGMAAFGKALLDADRPHLLVYPFWIIFLVWQLFPVLTAAFSVEFDFRNLLRFPLRFSSFVALSLIYGLFDPAALMGVVWLLALTSGILLARPELAPWLVLVVPTFLLANLLISRTVFAWLERLLAKRRAREIAFVVFLLAVFAFQGTMMTMDRWGGQAGELIQEALRWTRALPPGLAGDVLLAAERGEPAGAMLSALGVALYAVLGGFLLVRRLRRQYRGEDLGESTGGRAQAATDRRVAAGWELPALSGTVAALFEKEVRYILRNGVVLMSLLTPLFLFGIFSFSFDLRGSVPGFIQRDPGVLLPMAAGFVLMVLMPISYNSFAYDGRGVQLLLVAPIRFGEVMLAKNLLLGILALVEIGVMAAVLSLLIGVPRFDLVVVTLGALVFAVLVNFSVGNLLSLYYPRQFDFGKFRQRQAGMTVVVTILLQIVVFGTVGTIIGITMLFGVLWLAALVLLIFAAGSLFLYRWSLETSTTVALVKREVLLAELTRN
jgi:ABC-2 type transport system permease protein